MEPGSKSKRKERQGSGVATALILLLYAFLLFLPGCMPSTKTQTPLVEQSRKQWEKERLKSLLSVEKINRKDMAFLLAYYLDDLAPFFEKNPLVYSVPEGVADDTKGLKEKIYIDRVLSMGWMRNFPDGRFYPLDELRRFQLAIILHRVSENLPFLDDKELKDFEIKDVPYSDYTHKVIAFAVGNGFLKLEDGYFLKDKNVTGYEAARSLSVFRKKLKK